MLHRGADYPPESVIRGVRTGEIARTGGVVSFAYCFVDRVGITRGCRPMTPVVPCRWRPFLPIYGHYLPG